MANSPDPIELATNVVSAYVSNNSIRAADLPQLIGEVYSALTRISTGASASPVGPPSPAVPIKRSITNEYLISLEDGRKFKSLKRHLRIHHNMSPEQYREKWKLPADYPMVAPAYAKARSALALKMGLGQKRLTRARKVATA
jgi:predicted transcriptional regulator